MPKQIFQHYDKDHIATSTEETAEESTTYIDFGELKKITLLTMSCQNATREYSPVTVYFQSGPDAVKLAVGYSGPDVPIIFTGPLEIECNKLGFNVVGPEASDVIRREASWYEEVR